MKLKYAAPLLLALGLLIPVPGISVQEAAAAPVPRGGCTEDYLLCINEADGSHGLDGTIGVLASIECAAEYTGCIRRLLIGL
ncbi:MAG: hypothetical protein RQ745_08495 [Longimicrobiales bacterium]|nr:hypothetical protein [Longimicrobiales bacterium]